MQLSVLLVAFVGSAAASNAAGIKFLEENKGKPGVITLPSGLQYKVLREGSGDSHPTADSSCECHYEGRVAQSWPSGETFDSSYARGSPTSFAPNQVIKGWTEAMQLMVEGDKWEMCATAARPFAFDWPPSQPPQPPQPRRVPATCRSIASSSVQHEQRAACAACRHMLARSSSLLCPLPVPQVHSLGAWLRRARLSAQDWRRRRARLHDGDPADQR